MKISGPHLAPAQPSPPSGRLSHVLSTGVELAVFDCDYSLTMPNGSHSALFLETARSFGINRDDDVRALMKQYRGAPYPELARNIQAGLGFADSPEEFLTRLNSIARDVLRGERALGAAAHPVPGAEELLAAVRGIPYVVATGSLRSVTELSISQAGLSRYLSPVQLYCQDDFPYGKNDPAFWKIVLEGTNPTRVIGFEDRAYAAKLMLEAGIGRVFVRPSNNESFDELSAVAADRLMIVGDWRELL